MVRVIRGNYDSDKETTVNTHESGLGWITKRQYTAAIRRMGLIDGDYPRIADDGPDITVYDGNNFYAIIS